MVYIIYNSLFSYLRYEIIFMDGTLKKLDILSEASQYDLACACGTGKEDRRHRSQDGSRWLYPVTLPGGGYSILLKTLLSNCCANDCKYCPLRSDANARRCKTPSKCPGLRLQHICCSREQRAVVFKSSSVFYFTSRALLHL